MTTPGLPLEQRIFRSRRVGSGERFQYLHSRPETYKHWNQESLDAAITAVEVDGVSLWRAAVLYSIPKSSHMTTSVGVWPDWLNQAQTKPYLTLKEEEEHIISMVHEFLNNKFIEPPLVTIG